MFSPRISSAMEEGPQISKALSEPDNLFLLSRTTVEDRHCSSASSSASLLPLDSHPPLSNDQLTRKSHSTGQLTVKVYAPCFTVIHRHESSSPVLSSDHHISASSSADDDDGCTDANDAPAGLQYERFGEGSLREDTLLNHVSIPRRREFSEQFRDLAQLHQQADVPRAKWDDASRLFPKQFGLPPSVALNIWKQVDSDADMMLTESEYCLAAHLANKYASTGFILFSSQYPTQEQQSSSPLSQQERTSASINASSPCQRLLRRRKSKHQGNCDFVYLGNGEDGSHDLLISPDSRPLNREDDGSSCTSSTTPKTFEEPTEDEDEEEEDDHKGVSDDEIGVRALLPSSARLTRPPVDATALLCDENGGEDSDNSFSSSSSSTSSSSQGYSSSASRSPSSSSSPMPAPRVESVCSAPPSAKALEPIEVLSKFTHRGIEDILSLSPNRRRRLLASLVRAAKSTNYTLLRLNNELAGELQELCDQHISLSAQVRHLSELRT
ncbi:unnamed protein product [Taenia asiatica]|uniref:EH domain-containing protein n=1 Tax=Taenia asiatica TaxID=60517 RepID=A0A158R7W4_TAEAS|nr:unnamed protein product [Taenia asiatica]